MEAFEQEGVEFALPTTTTYPAPDERRPLKVSVTSEGNDDTLRTGAAMQRLSRFEYLPWGGVVILIVVVSIMTSAPSLMAEEIEIKDVLALEKWTGDLDGMVECKRIRALVSYSKTFYFLDGAEQRGITFEALRKFEQYINKMFKTGTLKVHVIIIPTPPG